MTALNAKQTNEVREMYKSGRYSKRELARMYKVSINAISSAIAGIVKPKPSVNERFMKFVDKRNKNECWEWKGSKDRDGYSLFRLNSKIERAHRVSYGIFKGQIPRGHLVRHKCDNPSCVNPKHLITGTQKQNVQDRLCLLT